MFAAANAEILPIADENQRNRRRITEIDPRGLTPHLKRDLGLIDFDPGRERRDRMLELADLRAGWL